MIIAKIKTAKISRTIKSKTTKTPIKSAQSIVLGEISIIVLLLIAILVQLRTDYGLIILQFKNTGKLLFIFIRADDCQVQLFQLENILSYRQNIISGNSPNFFYHLFRF